jgi:hypothetical protein
MENKQEHVKKELSLGLWEKYLTLWIAICIDITSNKIFITGFSFAMPIDFINFIFFLLLRCGPSMAADISAQEI